ncbi:MAG: hypothetical protein K2X91_19490, partial [Thermoleophilia bacterium]|nr:hypothetical protein [Thermoleophilia bacterium]
WLTAGWKNGSGADSYRVEAFYDGFAGSAIPIDRLDAKAFAFQTNRVQVDANALVQSARTANLTAEGRGAADVRVQAKAVSWASLATDALYRVSGGGGVELFSGQGLAEAQGTVQMDGTVQTGLRRRLSLTLNTWDELAGTVGGTASEGISYRAESRALESPQIRALNDARAQLALYGATNPELKAFYQGEINRISADLLAQGLADLERDPQTNAEVIVPRTQSVLTVVVDPIWAEAGEIRVRADQVQGGGRWDAPGDASVSIINNTPAFLELLGITIPESNGGLFVNGVLVTANGPINASNAANAVEDNRINVAGVDPRVVAGVAAFAAITPDQASNPPSILVDNALDVKSPAVTRNGLYTYPWPDITVAAAPAGQGIRNVRGGVTLRTISTAAGADKGDIVIRGPVLAANLTVIAGGDVFIQGETERNVEGDPYSIWGPVTSGTYGAGDATAFGVRGASPTEVAATLRQSPRLPFSLFGDRVTIQA